MIQHLRSQEIQSLVKDINPSFIKTIQAVFLNNYERFIRKEALQIIRMINIPKIVEERINGFEVSYTEKLILSVVHKELSAITWLGALLGFIIGFLPSILYMLGV